MSMLLKSRLLNCTIKTLRWFNIDIEANHQAFISIHWPICYSICFPLFPSVLLDHPTIDAPPRTNHKTKEGQISEQQQFWRAYFKILINWWDFLIKMGYCATEDWIIGVNFGIELECQESFYCAWPLIVLTYVIVDESTIEHLTVLPNAVGIKAGLFPYSSVSSRFNEDCAFGFLLILLKARSSKFFLQNSSTIKPSYLQAVQEASWLVNSDTLSQWIRVSQVQGNRDAFGKIWRLQTQSYKDTIALSLCLTLGPMEASRNL